MLRTQDILGCLGCKGRLSGRNACEPLSADVMRKRAQIGWQSGGHTENASEAGDSVNPGIWVGADAQEDWRKIGINGPALTGPGHKSGSIHKIKIFGFSHLEDSALLGI
jgi:hypothetical protein